ncbi:hypothetical protein BDV06DRAFT_225925 [Aspergillus oleicola]
MGANPDSPGIHITPLTSLIRGTFLGEIIVNVEPITKLLLEHGAGANGARDIDWEKEPDEDGTIKPKLRVPVTPLLLAVACEPRNYEPGPILAFIKLLIQHGADINYGNGKISPLYVANFYGRQEIASLLLEHGVVDLCHPDYSVEQFGEEVRWEHELEVYERVPANVKGIMERKWLEQ